ncbi:MAG: phosphatidylserine decarboxylase family protein [Thermodesulfobacteriota bacterium]|nr:phosphatidylserine decarboxylase family protein [Thermodesulfobacteriota bacterium]
MNQYKWADPPSRSAFPIARPGYPFIGAGAFVTAVFALAGFSTLSVTGLLVTGFLCWFFRDPDRIIPDEKDAVVSPADGKIVTATLVENSPLGKEQCLKISIFMSVFNVHVNRIPFTGKITKILYYPGKFFSANLDKASAENEHNAVFLHTETGKDICFVQIAGLVARRIVCNVYEGDQLERGQRFGMICFGSRLDVYLPAGTSLNVSIGDKVAAGASILAYLKS